ncbi:MAG: response regulator, partial [Trueperaceae bacterium]
MSRPVARLLIAEPDRLQLQLVDMLLASGSYELTMVESGREALEHLKGATPDLAILAMDLPDVEGDVICGKIRRVTRLARTPVILISPQSGRFGLSDAVRSRARRAGADLVLPRPLGDKNLRERVQALLDARDATPEREGHSTRIIEEVLDDLGDPANAPHDAVPGGTSPADDEGAHEAATAEHEPVSDA